MIPQTGRHFEFKVGAGAPTVNVKWSWVTGPLGYTDLCGACRKQLRSSGDVVEWSNGQRYHVGCLLDWLAQFISAGVSSYTWPGAAPDCGAPAGVPNPWANVGSLP